MGAPRFGVLDLHGFSTPLGPMSLAEKLEAWGYEAFWVPDVFSYTVPDPFVMLAAAAQRTRRLRLGTNVTALPFRSPFQLAKLAASVDVVSGGRLDLGVGIGLVPEEFALEQIDKKRRAPISDEYLEIVRGLLHEAKVRHAGPRYAFEDFTLEPRPVQRSLPIYVGAVWGGDVVPGVVRRAASLGDGFIPGRTPPENYREYREKILEHADGAGRDLGSFRWAVTAWTCLDPSRERALETIRSVMLGEVSVNANAGSDSGLLLNLDSFISGSVGECIEQIERYMSAGVDEFSLCFGCPVEQSLEQYEQFAKEVLPHFRG